MKINEFIEIMSKENSTKRIGAILETKKYLPIAEKRRIAEAVIEACTTDNGGFIQIDSLDKYIMFTIAVISNYTNLEFGIDGDYLSDYDRLCEAGLLDTVIATFDKEYARTNEILNMLLTDKLQHNSTEASIAKIVDSANNYIDKLIDTLKNKIEDMNLDLNNFNQDTLKGLLKLVDTTK
jgi:hypothetical protein